MAAAADTWKQLQMEALLNEPAGPPPAGTLPKFHQPASLNAVFYLTIALCITFSSLALIIRLYTRHFLLHSVGYDDYASVVAWLCLIVYLVAGLFVIKAGLGVHMWDLQLKDFFRLIHWINITHIVYNPTAFFAKLSILLQYSRVFNPTGKGDISLYIAIRICILAVFVFYFVRLFFDIFQCSPREKIWDPLITTGHCYDGEAAYKASGIFNVISDFAILILPVPSVWRLNMSLRKKLLTICVFASGFLACLISILRTYATWQVFESPDKSYKTGPFGLWSSAELSVGVITGCLPVMPKFYQHFGSKFHRVFSSPKMPVARSVQDSWGKRFQNVAVPKIKRAILKHGTGLNHSNLGNEPFPRHNGEYLTLDELEASRPKQGFHAGTRH